MNKSDLFIKHLTETKEKVNEWPEWKKESLSLSERIGAKKKSGSREKVNGSEFCNSSFMPSTRELYSL